MRVEFFIADRTIYFFSRLLRKSLDYWLVELWYWILDNKGFFYNLLGLVIVGF